jgi:uncharacterized protein
MIIETIFSTVNEIGQPNFAPMGVIWGEEELTVRPFRQSRTCHNLITTGYGVANLTDDVLAFVQSGLYDAALPHFLASAVPGVVFQDACSWRELAVVAVSGTAERAEVRCRVAGKGWRRDFLGFNRARSAIIEATILATRLHLHDPATVTEALDRYEIIVEKTGDEAEKAAFERIREFVRRWLSGRDD